MLEVTVHEAKELRDTQLLGKQDPYCAVRLGDKSYKTKVHEDGGKGANWGDVLRVAFKGKEDEISLIFTVRNSNVVSDTDIGSVTLPAIELLKTQPYKKWYQITHDNKLAGQICVSFKWLPALIFEIHEGKNLHDVNLLAKQDPFVTIKVLNAKKDKSQKTGVVKDGHKTPKWTKDNQLIFHKPTDPERDEKDGSGVEPEFDIEVRHDGSISDTLIGHFKLTWTQAWNAANGTPTWYSLFRGDKDKNAAGQLLVSITKFKI